jgi:hypothetical protein
MEVKKVKDWQLKIEGERERDRQREKGKLAEVEGSTTIRGWGTEKYSWL